jgi:hypothetical protein
VGEQDTSALVVKVTGKNFAPGERAEFFRSKTTDPGGIAVRETVFVSATELRATIDIAAGAALSLFDIRVTNTNGRSGKGSDLFQVVAKGARVGQSTLATVTFRCYASPGTVPPDPCATPISDADDSVDRARDDTGVAYSTGDISNQAGSLFLQLHQTDVPLRFFSLLLGDLAGPRACAGAIDNCNPAGPLTSTNLDLPEASLGLVPLIAGTWEKLDGGLFRMSCAAPNGYPGQVHFTFWLPNQEGHWGLNFNPRAYPPSTAATIRRIDNLTWTVETTETDMAQLLSWGHPGIYKRNGPSREGLFNVPFKFTIVASSLPSGAVTCN